MKAGTRGNAGGSNPVRVGGTVGQRGRPSEASQGTIESIGNNLRLMRMHPNLYSGVVSRDIASIQLFLRVHERQQ